MRSIECTVAIHTTLSNVWRYLTEPDFMKIWMGEPEMCVEVSTNWEVGSPILIKGRHHVSFENKGIVLQFEPQHLIQYSHLSSISHLADVEENYSVITLTTKPHEESTLVKVHLENFPTESIYKHLDFYWQGTIHVLKDLIEGENKCSVVPHR